MMFVFVFPLIWNVATGSPFLSNIPVFTIEIIGDSDPSDYYDLESTDTDCFSNFFTNSMIPKKDVLRGQRNPKSDSDQELKKSLDNTIEFLQKIRAELHDETPEKKDNFFSVGNVLDLFGQSFPIEIWNSPAQEESQESPVSAVVITTQPEAEGSDSEQQENKETDITNDEKSDGAAHFLNTLLNRYPYQKKDSLKKKVGNVLDLFGQSFPIEIRNSPAQEESQESPVSAVVITTQPEAEESDSEQQENKETDITDDEKSDGAAHFLSTLLNRYPYQKKDSLKKKTAKDDLKKPYIKKLQDLLFEMTNEI